MGLDCDLVVGLSLAVAFGLLRFWCCFGFMVFVGLDSWLGVGFSGFCFWLLAIPLGLGCFGYGCLFC